MTELTYRALEPSDDIEAITELLHRAYAPLARAGMHYTASHQDAATTRLRMEDGDTFVAVIDGRIVGVITLHDAAATRGSPFYDRPDVADFGQFAVEPARQALGIGSRLLEMVEARAREKGVGELALNTSEHATELISMYERKGFRFIEYVKWEEVNYRSRIFSKRIP